MREPVILESGLKYKLDLQEGSRMYTPSPTRQARQLPVSILAYGHFFAGPEHFTDRNQFRCLYQVFVTRSGRGRFWIDGREYIAEPDTVALLDCGHPHRYESAGGVWEHEWVNFTGASCQVYEQLINPDGFAVHPLESNREILAIMHEIRDGAQRQDMPGFVHTSTRIIRLLDAIYALTVEQQRVKLADQRSNVLRSVQFMEQHYMDALTLEDLARAAFLSKYYYTRAFKRYIGMTPFEYLNMVRVGRAKDMLAQPDVTIDEIGWRVGFAGSRNLIRQFKQAVGMTPGEYRKLGMGQK